MKSPVYVVDYGVGNVGSVVNMIKRAGGEAVASGDLQLLSSAAKVLLPGVGSFDNAIQKLRERGLIEVLQERAAAGVPFLGICLGMQLMASVSEEGKLPGLGLIPGQVKRFKIDPALQNLKIPHMGWSKIHKIKDSHLLDGLDEKSRFYFVHSYHYDCADPEDCLLQTEYGYLFTSAIERRNLMGVQFHPEKSHRYGMQLFKNFVDL